MKRVGIVATSRPELGGSYQYTLATIEALTQIADVHCTLFTAADNRSYDRLNVPIRRLPGGALAGARILCAAAGLPVGSWFSDMDVVFAPIYSTYLLCSRPPFAFTLHDLQERYYPQNFSLAQRAWRATVNKLLVRRAAKVVCESRFVKQDIERFLHAPSSKIAVIAAPPARMFADIDRVAQSTKSRMAALALPERYVLYPAQFFPHKNHRRLVEAFRLVLRDYPDCWLLLTGERRYEYAAVFALVAELGLASRVRHLGYLETADLAVVYKCATVVVIPTLFESISIPMYEAFALGVPVCASDLLALPEQAEGAALLFDPLSVEDIALKTRTLLASEALREDLAEKGRARIGRLTLEKYAGDLERVIEDLGRAGAAARSGA